MRRLMAKMRKVNATSWKMLSSGERVMKVAMMLAKAAVVVAVIGLAFSVVVTIVVGVAMFIALGTVFGSDRW